VTAYDRIISGNPRHEILDVARSESIDLIVIGTHGRRGFSRIIQGSVAEAVVRHAPCSVLSVKQPEHDFVTLE
jgi:nucleotide-binding universal stress UspA family protein